MSYRQSSWSGNGSGHTISHKDISIIFTPRSEREEKSNTDYPTHSHDARRSTLPYFTDAAGKSTWVSEGDFCHFRRDGSFTDTRQTLCTFQFVQLNKGSPDSPLDLTERCQGGLKWTEPGPGPRSVSEGQMCWSLLRGLFSQPSRPWW